MGILTRMEPFLTKRLPGYLTVISFKYCPNSQILAAKARYPRFQSLSTDSLFVSSLLTSYEILCNSKTVCNMIFIKKYIMIFEE